MLYLASSHSSSSNRKMENCCKFKALNRLLPSRLPSFHSILLACSFKPKTNFFFASIFSAVVAKIYFTVFGNESFTLVEAWAVN